MTKLSVGDAVSYKSFTGKILNIVQATDRWGMPIDGEEEAVVDISEQSFPWVINVKFLSVVNENPPTS